MELKFKPQPFSSLTKILTGVVILAVLYSFLNHNATPPNRWGLIAILNVSVIVLLTIVWLSTPNEYVLFDNRLLIKSYLFSSQILLSTIEKVEVSSIGFTVRLFGTGGFFGYWGWYYSFNKGWVFTRATDIYNSVLITTISGRKYLISPMYKEQFVDETQRLQSV
jgi:hypothetical protein